MHCGTCQAARCPTSSTRGGRYRSFVPPECAKLLLSGTLAPVCVCPSPQDRLLSTTPDFLYRSAMPMAPGPAAMEQLACRPHQRCHSGCAGAVPHAEAGMKRQQETRAAITQEDHDARQKRRQAVPPPAARDGSLAPAPACCLLPAGGKQRLSGLCRGRIPVSGTGPGWTTGCAAGAQGRAGERGRPAFSARGGRRGADTGSEGGCAGPGQSRAGRYANRPESRGAGSGSGPPGPGPNRGRADSGAPAAPAQACQKRRRVPARPGRQQSRSPRCR